MFEFKKWEIRIAKSSDAEAACEIFKSSVLNICGPHYNNDRQILDYWNSNKTPDKVLSWIENKDFYFLVAQSKGAIEGLAFINETTGELYAVYLIPQAVGFGLGQKLLDLMLVQASKKKLFKVFLKSSLNAKSFYEKRGFNIVGQDLDVQPPEGIPHFKMEIQI
ncbi:hypothetical protein D3C87_1170360 [compost metagenome]